MNVLKTLFAPLILVATANAHALCVNPDGSLDDASLGYNAPIDILPMCAAQAQPAKKATVEVVVAPATNVKAKAADESASVPIQYVYGGGK